MFTSPSYRGQRLIWNKTKLSSLSCPIITSRRTRPLNRLRLWDKKQKSLSHLPGKKDLTQCLCINVSLQKRLFHYMKLPWLIKRNKIKKLSKSVCLSNLSKAIECKLGTHCRQRKLPQPIKLSRLLALRSAILHQSRSWLSHKLRISLSQILKPLKRFRRNNLIMGSSRKVAWPRNLVNQIMNRRWFRGLMKTANQEKVYQVRIRQLPFPINYKDSLIQSLRSTPIKDYLIS